VSDRARFERQVLPHVDAAYNLARWLTRNEHDAQDVVQEAWLRASRYFGGFRGEQFRPWWLTIVRHTCYTWLKDNRPAELVAQDDADAQAAEGVAPASDDPHEAAVRNADRALLNRMGFNNAGAYDVAVRLRAMPRHRPVVGVNIGKSKLLRLESVTKGGTLTGYEASVSKVSSDSSRGTLSSR